MIDLIKRIQIASLGVLHLQSDVPTSHNTPMSTIQKIAVPVLTLRTIVGQSIYEPGHRTIEDCISADEQSHPPLQRFNQKIFPCPALTL